MKTMKHTTKTNHKLLSLNDLGGSPSEKCLISRFHPFQSLAGGRL